jgi:hypothetical protein
MYYQTKKNGQNQTLSDKTRQPSFFYSKLYQVLLQNGARTKEKNYYEFEHDENRHTLG